MNADSLSEEEMRKTAAVLEFSETPFALQLNALGLTITKHLAKKSGGDITLRNQPFVETVFTVKLRKMDF